MTIPEAYDKLMQEEIKNLVLPNEDALNLLQYIVNRASLHNFKITINYEKGKTQFKII